MKQNAAEIANIKINAAVAAHVLGISSVTFSKMISTGVLKRADPKKGYRLGDVVGAVVGHYQRLAGNRSGDAGHERSLASARAASALAQADERRLRVGILRGRYVSRASV